jgi:hypothetical protein
VNHREHGFVNKSEVAEKLLELIEHALSAFELLPFWWKVWILELKVVCAGDFDTCNWFDTDKGIAVLTGTVVGTLQ